MDVVDLTTSSPEVDRAPLPAASAASSSRPRTQASSRAGGSTSANAIYIPSDSESDDGEEEPAAGPSRFRLGNVRGRPNIGDFQTNLARIDAALARHHGELNRLSAQEAAEHRAVANAPRQAGNAPRIGLGGAVYRNGSHEAEVEEAPPARRRPPRRGLPRDEDGNVGFIFRQLADMHGDDADAAMDAAGDAGPGPRSVEAWTARIPMAQFLLNMTIGIGRRNEPPEDNVAGILAKITASTVPPARAGYTNTWDMEEIEKSAPIVLDSRDKIVKPKTKPYLACSNCPEPLRNSGATRDNNDRVWALRCGHLLDERCLTTLCAGPEPQPEPESKKRRTTRSTKGPRTKQKPVEHAWNCPVCSRQHTALFTDGKWTQPEARGAVQIFV